MLPLMLSPVLNKSVGTLPDKAQQRIGEMAKEFEATFLSMLIKEMRQASDGEGLFAGDSGDVQGGLFDLYLSQHLAQNGGFGFAAALERQLKLNSQATRSGPLPHDSPPASTTHAKVAFSTSA